MAKMKIENRYNTAVVQFDKLCNGEIFFYQGCFYLKIVEQHAVRLDTYEVEQFFDHALVNPRNATLTIN